MKTLADRPFVDIHSHRQGAEPEGICVSSLFYQDYENLEEGQLPSGWCSIGLHPWHIQGFSFSREKLKKLCRSQQIIGVGEIGLDRLCSSEFDLQVQLFIDQARVAEEAGLPVILHVVKAFDDLLRLKKLLKPRSTWIVHGFRGKAALTEQLLDAGLHISFGSHLLGLGDGLRESLRIMPLDRLFLETDDADMPISDIYAAAAHLLETDLQELTYFVYQNFETVFDRYGA